ncbi:MAG: hypothetical protein PHY43_11695 [Verrucomicrobiales bacterium]|nr:hypothetical protein [Verrucomicrobiales bacterium]
MTPPISKRDLWKLSFQQRAVWLRACKLGLTAGCVQAAVNQGDIWLHHAENAEVIAKTILSPVISFALVLVAAAETWVQKSPK